MSVLSVTATEIVNVCACGAENIIQMGDVVINGNTIVFPFCPVCEKSRSFVAAQPYDDGWGGLDDSAIRRSVVSQAVHYHALKHPDTDTFFPGGDKAALFARMDSEGRYCFVDKSVAQFTADVHPLKEEHWKKFKETGVHTPKIDQIRAEEEAKAVKAKFKDSIKKFVKGEGGVDRTEFVK